MILSLIVGVASGEMIFENNIWPKENELGKFKRMFFSIRLSDLFSIMKSKPSLPFLWLAFVITIAIILSAIQDLPADVLHQT